MWAGAVGKDKGPGDLRAAACLLLPTETCSSICFTSGDRVTSGGMLLFPNPPLFGTTFRTRAFDSHGLRCLR